MCRHQAVLRNIHELREVRRAIRCGGVVHENRRGVVAVGVDVRQHEPRVGRARLGRKRKPPPFGEERVPRVHQRSVAFHQPGLAARERHDIQPAVRAHQQPVTALHEHDPAAERGRAKGVARSALRFVSRRLTVQGREQSLRRSRRTNGLVQHDVPGVELLLIHLLVGIVVGTKCSNPRARLRRRGRGRASKKGFPPPS